MKKYSSQVGDERRMVYHDRLLRRTTISGTISVISPLLIGSGEKGDGSKGDIFPVTTVYEGKKVPYIPGSSLKGVFKIAFNRLLAEKNINTCYFKKREKQCGWTFKNVMNKASQQNMNDLKICLSCKIFGTMGLKGLVTFSDCLPINGENYSLGTRHGVAIDRLSGKVAYGAKFNLRYVEPESKFDFRISLKNLPKEIISLFFIVMHDFNRHLNTLGGFKSKGFGQIKFQVDKVDITNFPGTTGITDGVEFKNIDPDLDPVMWSKALIRTYATTGIKFDYKGAGY